MMSSATLDDTSKVDAGKPEAMTFDSKEERENYYRWVYCVKHGIGVDRMADFGVKPLTAEPGESAASPVSPARKGKQVNIEMTAGMARMLVLFSWGVTLTGGLIRWTWNFFALVTACVVAGMIIGSLMA